MTNDPADAETLVQKATAELAIDFIPASSELFRRGLALFDPRSDKEWSLVD